MSASKRSFMATVADLRTGRTQDDLTEQLGLLAAAVMATGRGGKLIFTLELKPAAKDSKLLAISDKIELKAPKEDRAPTLMFAKDDGTLSMEDPDAVPRGPLRSVDTPAREVKEVAGG